MHSSLRFRLFEHLKSKDGALPNLGRKYTHSIFPFFSRGFCHQRLSFGFERVTEYMIANIPSSVFITYVYMCISRLFFLFTDFFSEPTHLPPIIFFDPVVFTLNLTLDFVLVKFFRITPNVS